MAAVMETSIKLPESRRGDPRRVAGLSVRTRNADEGSADGGGLEIWVAVERSGSPRATS